MRAFAVALLVSLACLAPGAPAAAQEGHPLKGSWLGTWGQSSAHGADIVVVLDWDGKTITGTINPGTDNIPVRNATLDPDGWVVRLEADGKDRAGAPVSYLIEGRIENLSFHNRSIVGTWKSQRESGPFKISRQ